MFEEFAKVNEKEIAAITASTVMQRLLLNAFFIAVINFESPFEVESITSCELVFSRGCSSGAFAFAPGSEPGAGAGGAADGAAG